MPVHASHWRFVSMKGKRSIFLFVIQFTTILLVGLPAFAQVKISNIIPSTSGRGTTIAISGSGFSTTPSADNISFPTATDTVTVTANDTPAPTSTSLSVTVPPTAVTGKLYVQVAGNKSNPVNFNVSNIAPVVNAGTNQNLVWPTVANLSGSATDDGLKTTLTTTWSRASGPGTVTFGNANLLATTATFSKSGKYVLQLAANDGQLTSNSSVTIIEDAPPVVNAGPNQTVTDRKS